MYPIKKVVFPVAGHGTRFLPATKAMPKELLPIVTKPLIQWAAEEAVLSGIDTLIFVTGRNKRAIEDHFDRNHELEMALNSRGQSNLADIIRNIVPKNIECIFVRQPEQLGLGHAILCARRAVGSEPFAVILADDFIVNSRENIMQKMIAGYLKTKKSQICVMPVEGPSISNYGVVKLSKENGSVQGLVEKPHLEEAPSNLASIGRYILTEEIFDYLQNLKSGKNDEIQLADAINSLAKRGQVEAVKLNGLRFDCGSVDGFVAATNFVYEQQQKLNKS